MVPGCGKLGTSYAMKLFLVHLSLFVLGPILALVDISLVVIITRFASTGQSNFGWKLRKGYFLNGASTSPEPSPGNIIAWSGLIEKLRTNKATYALPVISILCTM